MSSQVKRFVPFMQRVLVQKVKPETQTKGGLFLPESSARSSPNTGVVVRSAAEDIKEGTTVYVPEFGGAVIRLDGEDYHLYRKDDLLGKLE